jgi:membrane-anchored protein YejM (alkaline phosphatase superfamily)
MTFIGAILIVFANIMYLLFNPDTNDHVRTWHYFIIAVPCLFGLIMVVAGLVVFAYRGFI